MGQAKPALNGAVETSRLNIVGMKVGCGIAQCRIYTREADGKPESTARKIVTASSDLELVSQGGSVARLSDFVTLMKPRVMMLAVFTALVGLTSAPRELDPLHAFVAVLDSKGKARKAA